MKGIIFWAGLWNLGNFGNCKDTKLPGFRPRWRRLVLRTSLGTLLFGSLAVGSFAGEGPKNPHQFPLPGKHVPWLREVQQPPAPMGKPLSQAKPAPSGPELSDLLTDSTGRRIGSLSDWQKRRQEIRRWWLEFLGLPQHDPNLPKTTLQVLQKEEVGAVARYLVSYQTQPGWTTQAYLLFPRSHNPLATTASERLPGLVVFHSTTNETIRQPAGLTQESTKAFGLQAAQQGMVALCPRCFLWTETPPVDYKAQVARFQKDCPGAKGMAKMLLDAIAAVDLLAGLPGVDAQRIGAVGHSLGAKEVLYLAAFDERIQAAVASEGGVGLRFSNWDAPWYLGEAIRSEQFGREHHELLALAAPRAFLLLGGDSADGDRSWPFVAAAMPVYRLYTEQPALGLWNHRQGHSVPPEAVEKIFQWLRTYLQVPTDPDGASF